MRVWSSTQHPSEVQNLVAHMLGVPGGGGGVRVPAQWACAFGGKESQAAQWACLAALAAHVTGRPAKLRLDRDDDMTMTGKRHDVRVDWRCGFDGEGVLGGVDVELAGRCGYSADLSLGVNDRAMFHADNAYHLPGGEDPLPARAHRHGVEHRVRVRVRGPAGDAFRRVHDGRRRDHAGARSAGGAPSATSTRRARRHSVRNAGRRSRRQPDHPPAGAHQRVRGAAAGDRAVQREGGTRGKRRNLAQGHRAHPPSSSG